MIDDYLNQAATLKSYTAQNEYGEATTTSSTIAVRWEAKRRLVRDAQGHDVVSEARVFTKAAVGPKDVLTYGGVDWPVIAVSDVPGLDGDVQFREVAV